LMTGGYLLIALGLAQSRNRFVAATALRLRQASRRLYPVNPGYARKALLAQHGESCLRLVRALAVETHENWLEAIRYLNVDHLKEHKN
jgi:hypothetical protein